MSAPARGRHLFPSFTGVRMARESDLQDRRQLSFRLHDVEQTLRNLFRASHAGFSALRFADPLVNVAARGVIQFVIPTPKRAIFSENALELIGDFCSPFFAVQFNLKTGDAAFRGSRSLLHALVDEQNVPAVSRGKKRCAKRKSIDIAFYFDLTTQPPRFGCIEWYVDNDPIEAGTHPLKSGLKTLRGKSRLGCGGFRHGRKPGDGILI